MFGSLTGTIPDSCTTWLGLAFHLCQRHEQTINLSLSDFSLFLCLPFVPLSLLSFAPLSQSSVFCCLLFLPLSTWNSLRLIRCLLYGLAPLRCRDDRADGRGPSDHGRVSPPPEPSRTLLLLIRLPSSLPFCLFNSLILFTLSPNSLRGLTEEVHHKAVAVAIDVGGRVRLELDGDVGHGGVEFEVWP